MVDITRFEENEIQALIILGELYDPIETPNNNSYKFYPKSIAEARTYFRRFAVDVSDTIVALMERGHAVRDDNGSRLTEQGLTISRELRRARPPIWYWYKDFYTAIKESKVFSEYCERTFGKDMSQHGFSDLAEIDFMLTVLDLSKESRVLDVGCGNGNIAEYISDVTEADVTGIDYIPEAIAQARRRTVSKQSRLHFMVGNLEQLDLESQSYDAIISIDSIFFGKDMKKTVVGLKGLLKESGVMAVFCDEGFGATLKENGLIYDVYDRSREHYGHLQLKHRVAQEMKEAFEEEGNGFIAENLLTESLDNSVPYDSWTRQITRYFYHVEGL